MQNAAFNALGLNCTYIAFRVPKGELKESVDSLRSIQIAGFNVTVPHKVEVTKYIDEMDPIAKRASAVNTVKNIEGIFRGFNTDIHGFIEPLRSRKVIFEGMRILLLGTGGAARAIVAALSEQKGISQLAVAGRDKQRSCKLVEMATTLGLGSRAISFDFAELQQAAIASGMIVNSTTIGLENEPSPIHSRSIKKGAIVYDLVYKPVVTNLIENAREAGADVVYGYEMLIEQGAKSFEIWTGLEAPKDIMKKNLFGVFGEPQ